MAICNLSAIPFRRVRRDAPYSPTSQLGGLIPLPSAPQSAAYIPAAMNQWRLENSHS
jgi:hypothetical protein